jgi:hypothetical protein
MAQLAEAQPMANMPQQIAPAAYRVGAIGIPNAISVLLCSTAGFIEDGR